MPIYEYQIYEYQSQLYRGWAMFTLEEYIFKRKKEDGINELDSEKSGEHSYLC